jgi:folate-binding protein YgfZ
VISTTGLLRFAGADAPTFLQGQLSCDVAALQPLRATHGSYNTPKGRMLANFLLWRVGADYFMQLPRELCEPVRKRLSMYVLRSKVQVADVSADHALFGVTGDSAEAALAAAGLPAGEAPLTLLETAGALVMRLEAGRFEVIGPADQAAALQSSLAAHATAAGADEWRRAAIRAGVPEITAATQEEFVPQMANLDLIGGVSFSKGCYPGQEIVARMHYLGKLKQRMVLAHVETGSPPVPGDKLYTPELPDQASGMVVNAAPAPGGGFDLLAVAQTSTFSTNGLHFGSATGPVLQLLSLPYSLEAKELPKT